MRRRHLGLRLRELRLHAGRTAEDIAAELLVSPSKITRIETGARGVSQRDVRDLCAIYGVDGAELDYLMSLARTSRDRSAWWQQYDPPDSPYVGRWTRTFVELESAASVIRDFQSSVVLGLLQSEAYARAITERTYYSGGTPDPEVVEEVVRTRLRRRSVLDREPGVELTVMMDEAVLHRQVGGAAVMREQIDHLLEQARRPNITIRIIPFDAGGHLGMNSNFTMLEGDDPHWQVVYVEGLAGQYYLEDQADLDRYDAAWRALLAYALPPEESLMKAREIGGSYAL